MFDLRGRLDAPCHNIVGDRGGGNTCWRICLHTLFEKFSMLHTGYFLEDRQSARLEKPSHVHGEESSYFEITHQPATSSRGHLEPSSLGISEGELEQPEYVFKGVADD